MTNAQNVHKGHGAKKLWRHAPGPDPRPCRLGWGSCTFYLRHSQAHAGPRWVLRQERHNIIYALCKEFQQQYRRHLEEELYYKGKKKKISIVLLIKSSSFIKKKMTVKLSNPPTWCGRNNTKIYRAFPPAPVGAVMDLVDGFNFWVAWEFISFPLITVNLNSGSYSDRLF